MEFQQRAASATNLGAASSGSFQRLTGTQTRPSTNPPERSPGELFAFSQKGRRLYGSESLSEVGRASGTGFLLDSSEAFHEQVCWQQSRRELRLAQFERKKEAIREDALSYNEASMEKFKAQDRRQLQFQRQLAAINQSKAFAAQQQRNEQQKLRRELLQSQKARQRNAQQKKHELQADEPEAEEEDQPDVCRTIMASHQQRNQELEHARQFVRNNERLNDAYWQKLMPEGRMQFDKSEASKKSKSSPLRSKATINPASPASSTNVTNVSTAMRKANFQRSSVSGSSSTRSLWNKARGTMHSKFMKSMRGSSDSDLEDESNDPWEVFWSNWNRVHSRWRKQQESDADAAHRRRTVLRGKLEERKEKKQEELDQKAAAVRSEQDHRSTRALKKKTSMNAIHQAAFEETQQRLLDTVAKLQRRQEQKLLDQEAGRKERAALGKEASIAAEKIAHAKEHEHKSRQIAKEERSQELYLKKLTDMKERAALVSVRHQTKMECAVERKHAALDSFQMHARAGFEKSQEKYAHLQQQGISSTDDGASPCSGYKRIREPAAADLMALVGAAGAAIKVRTNSPETLQGSSDKRFPERIREELSKHLRVVGMNLKNVWKIMDLNGNGLVSVSEFQDGLKSVSWDPVIYKLGSPRGCFRALSGGAAQLTPAMFVGPADSEEALSPVMAPQQTSRLSIAILLGEGEEEVPEPAQSGRHGKRKAVSETPDAKIEDHESEEEENDEGEGDEEGQAVAPWAATEEDFVHAVETSLKPRLPRRGARGSGTDG